MLKHYVEFLYPGIFIGETTTQEIDHRDETLVEVSAGVVGFRFFDREEVTLDEETLKGQPKNYSGWFYFGREMTLEDVRREMSEQRILIDNMECNGWYKIVQLKNGQCYPLGEKDRVI